MNQFLPASTIFIGRSASELDAALIVIIIAAIRSHGPNELWHRIGDHAKAALAFLQFALARASANDRRAKRGRGDQQQNTSQNKDREISERTRAPQRGIIYECAQIGERRQIFDAWQSIKVKFETPANE
jgi:hypothetical protein